MVGTIGQKVQVFFCFHSIQNTSKRVNTQKKIIFGCPPPPVQPTQPMCFSCIFRHTHSVCNWSSCDGRSLGRYFRRIQKKVSWLHSASNLLLFQGFGQSEYSIAYILSPRNYFWIRLMWAFGVEVGTRNPEGGYPPSGGEVFHDVRDGSGRISPPIGQNRKESAADIRPPDCGFRR